MTYTLYIGDKSFSSWSLRGLLMLENFDLPYRSKNIGLYSGHMAQDMAPLAPARLVPVLQTPEGDVVQDTLAIAETLAERHPDAGLWPRDASARTFARWIVAEMHSGFGPLRETCQMNLRQAIDGFDVPEAVLRDLERIELLWSTAQERFGRADSPWLFGDYSLADVFYAPVAARIAGYGLPVGPAAQAYVQAHLSDPAFRRWRAEGLCVSYDPVPYENAFPADAERRPWPGPARLSARAIDHGPSENATCPYSGDPVTDFLELNGRVFGFCNAFCRDKTVNDAAAYPKFMTIYQS